MEPECVEEALERVHHQKNADSGNRQEEVADDDSDASGGHVAWFPETPPHQQGQEHLGSELSTDASCPWARERAQSRK